MAQFFAYSLFQILKKLSILTNPKNPDAIFCLFLFQILKKVYLQILKKPGAIFLLISFLNITNLKNTTFYTNNDPYKNHYTNNYHKNHYKHKKYIIIACITKITIKIFLLFYKKIYNYIKNFLHGTIIKKIFCLLNIRMVNQGLNLSLNELKLIAGHRNISDYENKSAKDLIKELRGSRPRLGIKRDKLKEVKEDF